jgi:hypothetical protein
LRGLLPVCATFRADDDEDGIVDVCDLLETAQRWPSFLVTEGP